MRIAGCITVLILLCSVLSARKLKQGPYRGVLTIDEAAKTELPFIFTISYQGKKPLITITNADERIVVDEITRKGDSLLFRMPVYDTEFRTLIVKGGLQGVWINHYRTSKNIIPFKATYGERRRFLYTPGAIDPLFQGRWEVTFSRGTPDSYKAIGIFNHLEQTDYVSGTFLTETGDYRYLEGMKHGNRLELSAFDGSRAYLFTVEYAGGQLVNGLFYSGAHFKEPWTAVKNATFALRDPNLISRSANAEALQFSFPDPMGKQVSLADKKFENKPIIVQIMGTWCPNCMDESKYLTQLYKQYNSQGLEIVGVSFEKTDNFEKAAALVSRFKQRLGVGYDLLVTSKTGRESAGKAFSTLTEVTAFPTTLFLNKQHRVVRVHTGFSGPATGAAYEDFKKETEALIDQLLE